MHLLILGATGGTGQCLVKQALDKGHEVTILVRSPEKLDLEVVGHAQLQVITGNVLELEDVTKAMKGCNAVLSALGGRPGLFTPCDIYTKSCDVIIKAMKENNITRFISLTSWGTKDQPGLPFIWRYILKPTIVRHVVADMSAFEDHLINDVGEDINWTVIKPPGLTNTPATGQAPHTEEGQMVSGRKHRMSRSDVAVFMLECLNTDVWDRKLVAICGGVPPQSGSSATSNGSGVDSTEKKGGDEGGDKADEGDG